MGPGLFYALMVAAAASTTSPAGGEEQATARRTLSQYDQVGAEVNGTLDVTRLAGWMAETNANTVSFLLWDVDGHQYLDMVRFLDWQTKNGNKLEVWVTLIPPSESQPVGPPPSVPNMTDCIKCPATSPHPYGGDTHGGGFCCPVPSPDQEHCPGSRECCLSPLAGPGCENIKSCGTNPTGRPACPPAYLSDKTDETGKTSAQIGAAIGAGRGAPRGKERCSVPANSPLTDFNETSLVDSSKGWKGCNDYEGWATIIAKLAKLYPQVVAVNIDDFSANVPSVFDRRLVGEITARLGAGGVKLIPTFYHGGSDRFILKDQPWLAAATDGVLFYFRNEKGGQAECGQPAVGQCLPPDGGQSTAVTNALVAAGGPPLPCTMCCLCGSRAEASVANLASELQDFTGLLPEGHPLHLGMYFGGYSHCESPSPKYATDLLTAALASPAITGGVTVYTTVTPQVQCPNATDKGCIVKELFGAAAAAVAV